MSELRANKMPRKSAGGSSDGSSGPGGARRKLNQMSADDLACEEASIKMTMGCLQKRLVVVQEEKAMLERAQIDAGVDEWLSSHRVSVALNLKCERCNGTITDQEVAHKTSSGKRYHPDCWDRQQKEWKEQSEKDFICHICKVKWQESAGNSWKRSRQAKKWYCGKCAIENGVGQESH